MSNLFPITRFGTGGLGLTRDFDDVMDALFGRSLRTSSRNMNFSTVLRWGKVAGVELPCEFCRAMLSVRLSESLTIPGG